MRPFTFMVLFLFSASSYGQDLYSSISETDKFLWKISVDQARAIFEKGSTVVDESYFHTLLDTIPGGMAYTNIFNKNIEKGHYLIAGITQENLTWNYFDNTPFDVQVLQNNTDLVVQVMDSLNRPIGDAKVTIKNRRIRFDKKSKNYISKVKFKNEDLVVSHDAHEVFFKVGDTKPKIKQKFWRRALYGKPQRYVVLPIRYIFRLPIDGYKSIRRKRSFGVIAGTKSSFQKVKRQIRCTFSKEPCTQMSYRGYAVTSKPKYRINDTLKVKAYLTDQKGRPLESPLQVSIGGGIRKDFGKITPVNSGAYEWILVLDKEKYKLKLDKDYWVNLILKNKIVKSVAFRLEQYDLKSIRFAVSKSAENHINGKPFYLKLDANDENGLRLKDARVELSIRTSSVLNFRDNELFVPNAILDTSFILDANEMTEFYLPDSIFPNATINYRVSATLLNGANEVKKKSLNVDRRYSESRFDLVLDNDSLLISYINPHDSLPQKARLFKGANGVEFLSEITIPSKVKIHSIATYYRVQLDESRSTIYLNQHAPDLSMVYSRNPDSITLSIKNPRKLPFSYFIYKANKEVGRGFGMDDQIIVPAKNNKNYTFSIEYVWAGKVVNQHYGIPLQGYMVDLSIHQPSRIFPGQKVNFEIEALDVKGKPVANLDVAAFGSTAKLNHQPEKLVPVVRKKKQKKLRRNYQIVPSTWNGKFNIPYDQWQGISGLDTIEYYKFRFPDSTLYRIQYPVDDSITQLAPFVSRKGKLEKVHVVLVDNRPVYFSWATYDRPYSFRCDPGVHDISIRTSDHLITLKKVEVFYGVKNIISIDPDKYKSRNVIGKRLPELDSQEFRNYLSFNFYYSHSFGPKPVWLEQDESIFLLPPTRQIGIAGPILPREVKFEYFNEFSHEFVNAPMFKFEFYPNLMKMWDVSQRLEEFKYLDRLNGRAISPNINHVVRTRTFIEQKEREYLFSLRRKKYEFSFATNLSSENGSLRLKLKKNKGKDPINLFFFKKENQEVFSHLSGSSTRIPRIGKGTYQFYILYRDKSYQKVEIEIKPKGTNFRDLTHIEILDPDEYSENIDSILQAAVIEEAKVLTDNQMLNIYKNLKKGTYQNANGSQIFGTVTDQITNEGLIAANVVIYQDGKFIAGTTSDFNGNYSIDVGPGFYDVEVSYIGYPSTRIEGVYAGFFAVDVALDTDNSVLLDEVVVVEYKVPLIQKDNTTSGGIISSQGIKNLPTRNISALASTIAGISVSDDQRDITIRGSRGDGTHYYIDGIRVSQERSLALDDVNDCRVVQGDEARSVYGANKVVLIKSKSGMDQEFYEASLAASGIRNNFSDEAFWKPSLRTNELGKINFSTTFPDDITKWNLHFIAAKGKYAGYQNSEVKSYKPIASILSLPKFMIESDTALANARTLNYTSDTLHLQSEFSVEQKNKLIYKDEKSIRFKDSELSLYPFTSTSVDSLAITYQVKRDDGYSDGEKRTIPILPKGLETSEGLFEILDRDTSFIFDPNSFESKTTIYFDQSRLQVLRRTITAVKNYHYLCNEQLASKLMAHLHDKILAKYLGEIFEGENEIIKILNELNERRNKELLWGWWVNNQTSFWITSHVVKALLKAKAMGYKVNINADELGPRLIYHLEASKDVHQSVELLWTMKQLDVSVNFVRYIAKIDSLEATEFYDQLRIAELKSTLSDSVDIDWLNDFKKETIFGNVYFQKNKKEKRRRHNLFGNTIQHTLLAYRILRMKGGNEELLSKIRQFFFEIRQSNSWQNTYEKISIVETLLPDLVQSGKVQGDNTLILKTDETDTIKNFPFTYHPEINQTLEITKMGNAPVYFTAYSSKWIAQPETKANLFSISTAINQSKLGNLTTAAAKPVNLRVDLEVKRFAEYVMIEIPIPAGTSYNSKSQRGRYEVHREYYDDRVVIFCRRLTDRVYSFNIDLFAKHKGTFTLNPAKVSLMYFPTFYGNNRSKRLTIE